MKTKTATENTETKIVFLSETESENDFSLYRLFSRITVFSRYFTAGNYRFQLSPGQNLIASPAQLAQAAQRPNLRFSCRQVMMTGQ